jgi:hypothetical protein
MGDEMSTEEGWLHIAKLEAKNRVSKDKHEVLMREHDRKSKRLNDISNAVSIAMSIFNPVILIPFQDKKKDKGDL